MKNKLPLIVALVFAVAGVLAVRSYVNKAEQNARANAKGIQVLAAGRGGIPAGTELRKDLLTVVEVPKQVSLPQAYGMGELSKILGRRTTAAIQAGEPILASHMSGSAPGGFSTLIPKGEAAYTVAIGRGIKPGLIQEGDHIDILASFALPKESGASPETAATWRLGSDMVNVVLFQNVTVLAVGDAYGGTAKSEGGGGADLTLALTLQEAQTLMFATQHGELGAVLRREGSTLVTPRAELPRITFQDIEKVIGELDTRRIIQVQKGANVVPVPVSDPNPVSK